MTGQQRLGVRRIVLVPALLAGLVLASCTDKPIEPAVTGPPRTVPVEVTDGSTNDGATTGTREPGVVEPRVLCVNGSRGIAYLTYTSTHPDVVEIPVGPDNQIVDVDGEEIAVDHVEAFAPGEQPMAVVYVSLEAGATWTIRDGATVSSVEAGPGSGPACPPGPVPGQVVEPPDPEIVVTSQVTRDAAGLVTEAVVDISLTGIVTTSRCPTGPVSWTPLPRQIRFDARASGMQEIESTVPGHARFTVDDPQDPGVTTEGDPIKGVTRLFVYVDADDVCVDAQGREHRAWATSGPLLALSSSVLGEQLCLATVEDEAGVETVAEISCFLVGQLAATGGFRVR